MVKNFTDLLAGKDLRSLDNSSEILPLIDDQNSFDELFKYLYNTDRAVIMKAIDIIEKITLIHKEYLQKYKVEILSLSKNVENIELKWHLAQLLPRVKYTNDEIEIIWKILEEWTLNTKESKIVRVNSLQSLYEFAIINNRYQNELTKIVNIIKQENIASINARIKKLGLK